MAHLIEQLYGLNHGFERIVVRPSCGVYKMLDQLPAGTKVGLETLPSEDRTAMLDGQEEWSFDQTVVNYWFELEILCEQLNLEIAYLEGQEQVAAYVQKMKETHKAAETLREFQNMSGFLGEAGIENQVSYLERVRALREAFYRAHVETEYFFAVNREQALLQQIAIQQPQVVLVGRDHGDSFMNTPILLEQHDLAVGTYRREGIPDHQQFRRTKRASLYRETHPDPAVTLANHLITRKYRAVTEGRICPEQTPFATGTWDLSNRPRGLFEIFVEKPSGDGTFSGSIEDSLGSAQVTGKRTDRNIRFTKTYVPDQAMSLEDFLGINYGQIEYVGTSRNGRDYQGTFTIVDSGTRGEFTLSLQGS